MVKFVLKAIGNGIGFGIGCGLAYGLYVGGSVMGAYSAAKHYEKGDRPADLEEGRDLIDEGVANIAEGASRIER